MLAFTSTYRRKSQNLDDHFLVLRDGDSVQLEVDEIEKEYQAFGPWVDLLAFCKLVVLLPPSTACATCVTDFNGKKNAVNIHPVLTVCKHFLHRGCLDKGVNQSAMKTSNTCPGYRTALCEPRKRLHTSAGPVSLDNREDNASSITSDTATVSYVAANS